MKNGEQIICTTQLAPRMTSPSCFLDEGKPGCLQLCLPAVPLLNSYPGLCWRKVGNSLKMFHSQNTSPVRCSKFTLASGFQPQVVVIHILLILLLGFNISSKQYCPFRYSPLVPPLDEIHVVGLHLLLSVSPILATLQMASWFQMAGDSRCFCPSRYSLSRLVIPSPLDLLYHEEISVYLFPVFLQLVPHLHYTGCHFQ